MNAGELVSIVLGTAMNRPPPAATSPLGLLGGAPVVGSGNPPTPCLRMHLEIATRAARSLALDDCCSPGAPFGRSLLHVDSAAWNKAEDGLSPGVLRLTREMRPVVVGSGYFGTP